MYDLTQIEVIMLTSFMDITHEKYTNNRITKSHLWAQWKNTGEFF